MCETNGMDYTNNNSETISLKNCFSTIAIFGGAHLIA
jgi:hypothetical protein